MPEPEAPAETRNAPPIEVVVIPCLADNYACLVKGAGEGEVLLIDAPEAAPIEALLDARGWTLGTLLITHHHHDHIGGVERLRARYGCKVVGPAAEADRLPPLGRAVADGDSGGTGALRWVVMAVPGHTLGHVAYHFPEAGLLFSGDSLMACGCGRLFEGTAAQMWHSLSRLAALPPETLVYSGHEYTQANLRFALSLDPDNAALILRNTEVAAARQASVPSIPATIAQERLTNPFLRAGNVSVRRRLGLENVPNGEVFAEIRARKDRF